MERPSDSLPKKFKLVILCLSLTENTMMTLVYPILPFMVKYYLSTASTQKLISEYSGYLEGIYRLMQAFASIWLSMLSYKLGKKKVLIFCTLMHIISSISLAFCTSYTQAFINRIVAGFCAGSMPVTKSLIRETTTDKNISEVYKYFAIGIGIANIVGPLFSMASTQSLSFILGEIEFFKDYPYCFPLFCQYFLLSSLMAFFTLFIAAFYLVDDNSRIDAQSEIKFSLLSNKQYLLTVLSFCLLAYNQVGFRLIFSLFCSSSESIGGMGIKYEYQVSLIQLCGGIFICFISPVLTKRLHFKFGLRTSLVFLLLAFSTASTSLGICALLYGYLKYIGLVLVYILGNTSIILSTLYNSICISNSITEDLLSTANGFSEAVIAISRFSGNSCFGVLFGWSASNGIEIPGVDVKFPCFVLSSILIVNLAIVKFGVDSSVEKKQKKDLTIELIEKRIN